MMLVINEEPSTLINVLDTYKDNIDRFDLDLILRKEVNQFVKVMNSISNIHTNFTHLTLLLWY